MTPVNAVARVRFSSAKAQRVHLVASQAGQAELLCLESRQELPLAGHSCLLYVITGSATLIRADGRLTLQAGELLAPDEDCALANIQEQRLVCLAFKLAD